MNAYHNMSGPPLTTARQQVKPVGRQVVLDLRRVGLHAPGDNLKLPSAERDAIINDWLTRFVQDHKAELDAVKRPTGFMIGCICENVNQPLKGNDPKIYRVCGDPILTLAVLGRMAGMIYIPRRDINLSSSCAAYKDAIAFPEKYFPNLHWPEVTP
ncbi:MAG: hypothetical protein IJR99_00545 [Kiritimatiellae bacterium]|nr:hypothetical protein [Kiritimatiellia bacterium]